MVGVTSLALMDADLNSVMLGVGYEYFCLLGVSMSAAGDEEHLLPIIVKYDDYGGGAYLR